MRKSDSFRVASLTGVSPRNRLHFEVSPVPCCAEPGEGLALGPRLLGAPRQWLRNAEIERGDVEAMTVKAPNPPALGSMVRRARKERGWSRVDLVRKAGYKNVNKGLRWLDSIESGSNPFPPRLVLNRLAEPLELAEDRVTAGMKADFDGIDSIPEFNLVERLMPAVYRSIKLPVGVSVDELELFAAACARERGREVCLGLSPVRRVYFGPNGRRSVSLGFSGQSSSTLAAILGG